MEKVCSHCHVKNQGNNRFCIGCGSLLPEKKYTVPFKEVKISEQDYRVLKFLKGDEQVSDFMGTGSNNLFLETVRGMTVENLVKRDGNPGLPEKKVIEWSKEILEVLEYLHSQSPPVLYKHINPSSIIITASGKAMLQDLEITAKINGTDTGYNHAHSNIDSKIDISSFGITLFYLLTGTKLDKNSTAISQSIHPELADFILETQKYITFANAKEMSDALNRLSLKPIPSAIQQSREQQITQHSMGTSQLNTQPANSDSGIMTHAQTPSYYHPPEPSPSPRTAKAPFTPPVSPAPPPAKAPFTPPVSPVPVRTPFTPPVSHTIPSNPFLTFIKAFLLLFLIAIVLGGILGGKQILFYVMNTVGDYYYEKEDYEKAIVFLTGL